MLSFSWASTSELHPEPRSRPGAGLDVADRLAIHWPHGLATLAISTSHGRHAGRSRSTEDARARRAVRCRVRARRAPSRSWPGPPRSGGAWPRSPEEHLGGVVRTFVGHPRRGPSSPGRSRPRGVRPANRRPPLPAVARTRPASASRSCRSRCPGAIRRPTHPGARRGRIAIAHRRIAGGFAVSDVGRSGGGSRAASYRRRHRRCHFYRAGRRRYPTRARPTARPMGRDPRRVVHALLWLASSIPFRRAERSAMRRRAPGDGATDDRQSAAAAAGGPSQASRGLPDSASYMASLAGKVSKVSWYGTFGTILAPAAAIGALLRRGRTSSGRLARTCRTAVRSPPHRSPSASSRSLEPGAVATLRKTGEGSAASRARRHRRRGTRWPVADRRRG